MQGLLKNPPLTDAKSEPDNTVKSPFTVDEIMLGDGLEAILL